jgi:UDP:flavonoid glycosyltransferase YjiC (YdhE family)
MTAVLFVTWDGGGNVPPMLAIAAEVQNRGDSARFIGHPAQRASIEAAGFAFEPYSNAHTWSALAPKAGLRADLGYAAVFADRGLGADVVASLRRAPADRVLVDGLLIGAIAALAVAGRPYTILVHTLRSVMYNALLTGALGLILRVRGFDVRRLYELADAELVVTSALLDEGSDAVAANVHYTGPTLPAVNEASGEGAVLVSLSTTYVAGQAQLLQHIIDSLAERAVDVFVTTGPAVNPAMLNAPANTIVHAYLAHDQVMPKVNLVVGHGGHGTTMLALAHGLPLLVIPTNLSFDQPAIGAAIAAHGLGMTAHKRGPFNRALDELLSNSTYGEAARKVGAQLRHGSGAAAAANYLR